MLRNTHIVIAVILFSMFFLLSGCDPENRRENDAYEDGYEDGYESAYEAGYYDTIKSNIATAEEVLADMDLDDIIAFIEESSDELEVWTKEDLSALFAYALTRGYVAGVTDTWDNTMEEYISGYDMIPDSDLEHRFGIDQSRLNTIHLSPVLEAWETWEESR